MELGRWRVGGRRRDSVGVGRGGSVVSIGGCWEGGSVEGVGGGWRVGGGLRYGWVGGAGLLGAGVSGLGGEKTPQPDWAKRLTPPPSTQMTYSTFWQPVGEDGNRVRIFLPPGSCHLTTAVGKNP